MLRRTGSRKNEKGFTLLEYCAGAAVVVTVLWAAFNTLGGSVGTFMGSIGTWLSARQPVTTTK